MQLSTWRRLGMAALASGMLIAGSAFAANVALYADTTYVDYSPPSTSSEAYNMQLGWRRAQWIKAFLVSAGLSADRIDIASAGEHGAKGTLPEYSYGYDRRVDIIVTGGVHHP